MKMPGFRLPQNQKFAYKPRFWDPKEEERQERNARLKKIEEGGLDGMKERISGTFKRTSGVGGMTGTYRSRQVAKSNFVLIGIIVALVFLCYFAFTVYLPRIEAFMG